MAEQMVSIYDPTVAAYREVPVSVAKEFIASAKKVEAKIKALGGKKDA